MRKKGCIDLICPLRGEQVNEPWRHVRKSAHRPLFTFVLLFALAGDQDFKDVSCALVIVMTLSLSFLCVCVFFLVRARASKLTSRSSKLGDSEGSSDLWPGTISDSNCI